MTVVVTVRFYTMGAAAKQHKNFFKKGDLKLWHVEMLTKPKTLLKRWM
jgi:hypothetical protein